MRVVDLYCDYGLTYTVLNAALCGVPQRRKRFVMIGKLGLSHFRSFMSELGNILHCCSDIETIDWEFTSRKDGRQ